MLLSSFLNQFELWLGLILYFIVSSPAAPPTRGKERLVAIDTKIGPMMSLTFHISGCGLGTSQALIGQSQVNSVI